MGMIKHKPTVSKLLSPVHAGDWHDRPMRWNVAWNGKNQMFSTKKDAQRYARIWKQVGGDELAAIHAYQEESL